MNQTTNLVQVVYSFDVGGSEILARNIALGLHGRQYRCSMVALEKGGPLEAEFRANKIPCFVASRQKSQYFSVMFRIYLFLRKHRPNIVHTHHLHELIYSIFGAKLIKAKVIHTEHEYFSLLSKKKRRYLRILSPFCSKITTVGHEISRFLVEDLHLPAKKLVTIQNGIDLENFGGQLSYGKGHFGFQPHNLIVGTVSRLEKEKDQITLLRAFRKVLSVEKDARLLIVGDGTERESLQRECDRLKIDDFLVFAGIRTDIAPVLAMMDTFVLTSVREGLPLALLEAMAMEKPVISTCVGNIPEVIQNNENGLLVDPEDPDGLALAILRVLSNKSHAKSMGKEARKFIEKNHSFKQNLEKYDALYQSILGRSKCVA